MIRKIYHENKLAKGKYAFRSDIYGLSYVDKNENDVGQVFILTLRNFMNNVNLCPKVWLVLFCDFSREFCKSLDSVWKNAAKDLKGKIHFGKIDIVKDQALTKRYKIEEIPSVKIFQPEQSIYFPFDYEGPLTKWNIVDFAEKDILIERRIEKIKIIKIEHEDFLNQRCKNKVTICFIIGIPMLEEGSSIKKNKYFLQLLNSLESRNEIIDELYWIETKNQHNFLNTIHHDNKTPFILAINATDFSYALLSDDLSSNGISNFVKKVLSSKCEFTKIEKGLKLLNKESISRIIRRHKRRKEKKGSMSLKEDL